MHQQHTSGQNLIDEDQVVKILVAEDNALLGKSLQRGMEEAGWTVDLARDGEEALHYAETSKYHVIILDWMLPKCSGLQILRNLRAKGDMTPAVMTTAKSAVADRVECLNGGADDYLVKPFELVELIARVNAVYRRSVGQSTSNLTVGALTLDIATHSAKLAGMPMDLTGMEYDMLAALAAKRSLLVQRGELSELLYQIDSQPDSNSLDVLLGRLRKKLQGSDVEIATVRGKGFILRVAPSPP